MTSHRSRSPVKHEKERHRQKGSTSRSEYERQVERPDRSRSGRRKDPIVEEDDRWTGHLDEY